MICLRVRRVSLMETQSPLLPHVGEGLILLTAKDPNSEVGNFLQVPEFIG